MYLRNTIHSHFVLPLLKHAESKGLQPEKILKNAGVSPDVIHQPRIRFTHNQYTKIVRQLWKEFNDEFFGLSVPTHKIWHFFIIL